MNIASADKLSQRSDYTHKLNMQSGRHGWLRLTPAYSVKIVEELISRYDEPLRVLDPFCGTGTTILSAAYHGHEGVTIDINPFLVWLSQTKMTRYSATSLISTQNACARVVDLVRRNSIDPVKVPPIHNKERWWNSEALRFLCTLRAGIEIESDEDSPERDLLLVAFCRTLIALSNAAFNHQSMSFTSDSQLLLSIDTDMGDMFREDAQFVLKGAWKNPKGAGNVIVGDSRQISRAVDGFFDLVITSPPYANRMSYIRELRPYMYWLQFLNSGRDAGELDWRTIGGTWGVATSRLANRERSVDSFEHPLLDGVLHEIAHNDNKNGVILANYVAKYFDDMWMHFNSLTSVLNTDSEIHYIVGNSTFYGILLSVQKLYAAMLERLGFDEVKYRPIRKRNSKKELFEFDVSARWTKRECREPRHLGTPNWKKETGNTTSYMNPGSPFAEK